MMITTTKGDMDDSLLVRSGGAIETDKETTSWIEYRLGVELVHRSVHVALKAPVVSFADIEAFNG